MTNITYRINEATESDIFIHLDKCDNNFVPPLAANVSIKLYAKKIFENAVTFEAWADGIVVGLIAAYFNDQAHNTGYITNVSVLSNYMRMGIARTLMTECVGYACQNNFNEIRLEVNSANDSAIQLYRKFGFINVGVKNNFVQMVISGLGNTDKSKSEVKLITGD